MLPLECENHLITCPVCLGKGYCDENESRLSLNSNKATLVLPKRSLRLPAINSEAKNLKRHSLSQGSEFLTSKGNGDIHLPRILHSRTSLNKNATIHPGGDNVKVEEKNFSPEPVKFERPQDTLKIALLKLKENRWDSAMQALVCIVQISKFQPELIDPDMPIVNRSICSLLRNIRSNVARTACQIAAELFRTMQFTQRPEFDELVGTLLQKTADMKKCIRKDANAALDAMAEFIPASHCIRVMVSSWGGGHKNPLVRATVSRIMNNIVTTIGVDVLLSATAAKDTRNRIFAMCAKFLLDGNAEIRANARTLFKLMLTHIDFEHVFEQEVDRKLQEKIKKQLVALKYETSSRNRVKFSN